jgi:hypothetical protein
MRKTGNLKKEPAGQATLCRIIESPIKHRLFMLRNCLLALILACSACTGEKSPPPPPEVSVLPEPVPPSAQFTAYWHQNKAELNAYDVEQERYGEMRTAEEIMVFVTEDFSQQLHVKLDDPSKAGADRVPVLKCNAIRRFVTGVYDYSLMLSVFTPVDASRHPQTLKITSSVQDWCGQSFIQLNATRKGFQGKRFSYFQTEADNEAALPVVLTEDELWNRLRINPASVDTGLIILVPGTWYLRLRHQALISHTATVSFGEEGDARLLRLQYRDLPRTLTIRFERAFPHRILGWEETDEGKILSRGTLKKTILQPYWEQHAAADTPWRDTLQLGF